MKRHGHARVDPRSPRAFAICDRCGQLYNHDDLQWQTEWRGRNLQNIHLLVCDTCLDVPQEQLRVIVLPPDPLPILNARPELADIGSAPLPPSGQIIRLPVDSGSFALTGRDATLQRSIHLTLAPGAYGLTGHTANLSLFPGVFGGPFSSGFSNGFGLAGAFIVNTGSFALSGHAAVLKRSIKLALDSGSYGITGQNANLVLTTGGPASIFSVNWVTTSSIPAEMTFARGSAGTYRNSSGVLVSASTGVARFDYNPNTLAHLGLLVEASATNYQFASSDFTDGTIWGLDSGATTAGSWTAPDGTGGFSFSPNGTSGASLGSIHSHHGLTSGSTYTTSVHAKAVTGRYQWLSQTERNGTGGLSAIFDLAGTSDTTATQVITWGTASATVASTSAKYLGNNVWKLGITWSMTLTGDSVYSNMGAADAGTGNTLIAGWSRVASTNSNNAGFWGIQLEAGAVATSFIYTTNSATATRSADLVSSTDAGLLAAKGWVVEVGELPTATALTLLGVNTIVGLGVDSTAHLTTADGGTQTTTATGTWNSQNRGGIAWDAASRVSISLNGGAVTTAANTRTTPTTLYFGSTNNGASGIINGHIRIVKAYTALTDAQLPTVSTVGA